MEKDIVNKKRDFGQKLQDFMASYRGKVIMNYAYSWGAAIVIAGTLFKLTHLPGANLKHSSLLIVEHTAVVNIGGL